VEWFITGGLAMIRVYIEIDLDQEDLREAIDDINIIVADVFQDAASVKRYDVVSVELLQD
jgi:hypothetical protein